jgi:hypothetical protein
MGRRCATSTNNLPGALMWTYLHMLWVVVHSGLMMSQTCPLPRESVLVRLVMLVTTQLSLTMMRMSPECGPSSTWRRQTYDRDQTQLFWHPQAWCVYLSYSCWSEWNLHHGVISVLFPNMEYDRPATRKGKQLKVLYLCSKVAWELSASSDDISLVLWCWTTFLPMNLWILRYSWFIVWSY